MEGDPSQNVPHIDVEKSLERVKQWPKIRQGYSQLCFFLSFVILYIVIITMQLKVGDSWAIGQALNLKFNSDSTDLTAVLTQDDFWNYLFNDDATGLMQVIFNNQWYNGQAFSTEEQGYVLDYDKLVGGLLITQQRGEVVYDGCAGLYGSSSYDKFYTECYTDKLITTNETSPVPALQQYFDYSNLYNGYAVFFGVASGATANLKLGEDLKAARWTDKRTRAIEIKFALYNGNYNAFSFVKVNFQFDKSGVFSGGNHIDFQTIAMEPMRTSEDTVRLVLEIVFMVLLANQIAAFLFDAIGAVKEEGPAGLLKLWTVVDIGNLSCLTVFVALRVSALWMIYNNPITVPTNAYQEILEQVAGVQSVQRFIIFFNIILSLLRLFKFYQFQERLNILNMTFAYAFTDLYHFVIMFAVIFGGFAVMAHFLFGLSIQAYSSIGQSLSTLWQMLLGNFDYPSLEYVSPTMAGVFFISFMFIVNMVLINVLLAILIDSYAKACEVPDAESVADELGRGISKLLRAARRQPMNDAQLMHILERAQARGDSEISAEDLSALGEGMAPIAPETWRKYPGIVHVEPKAESDGDNEQQDELVAALQAVMEESAWLKRKLELAGEVLPALQTME